MTTAEALASILPASAVVSDVTDARKGGRRPEAVVRPASPDEVATLMAWANREGVGVLPVASGRRARPVRGDGRYVVLESGGMSGITEYEAADLTLTAGAGTPFAEVTAALAEHSQWAPFDPPLAPGRSLGGLVSAGLSGPLHMGYGDLRNHVLGMTVVTGDGRVLRLGGRVVKNVAGFDVLKAVVGSRGTLAVITSVVLRAFPIPLVDRVLVLDGESVQELLAVALEVGTAPILPVSSVVVDALAEVGGRPALIVRLHGALETVDADQARLEDHIGRTFRGGSDVDLGRVRDRAGAGEVLVTVSARPSRLGEVLDALNGLDPAELLLDSYGGRVRILTPVTTPETFHRARELVESAGGAMRVAAPSMAGQAAGLGSRPSAGEVALIAGLRNAFDPGEVLWPARI